MPGNITSSGFTSPAEQRRSARRRLIVAAVVGALCFGGGIGIVAALKSPLDVETPRPTAPDADPSLAAAPPDDDDAPPPDPTPAPPTPPAPADTPRPEPPPIADAAPAPDAADDAPPADPTPATPATPTGKWWERARGKRCKIVFKERDRLIMREGELRRDETTTYGPFVDNPIALRIRAGLDPVVTPIAYGIHPRTKAPCLVFATVEQGSQTVKGVLPLLIGDDQLELVPVDGAER